MAIQLERRGDPVAFLGIIDSDLPDLALVGGLSGLDHARARLYEFDRRTIAPGELDAFTAEEQMIVHTLRRLAETGAMQVEYGTTDQAKVRRALAVEIGDYRAWTRYVPRPYRSRLTLLRSAASEEQQPLARMCIVNNGSPILDVHTIPGDHLSIMRPPGVSRLAAALRESLLRAPSQA